MQNIFGCYPEDPKSFKAKIKAFRRQLRGVTDLKFFFYRFFVAPTGIELVFVTRR